MALAHDGVVLTLFVWHGCMHSLLWLLCCHIVRANIDSQMSKSHIDHYIINTIASSHVNSLLQTQQTPNERKNDGKVIKVNMSDLDG